ncbi:MAG: hypothetical protein M3H12_03425 [Chromatiales bacterium]
MMNANTENIGDQPENAIVHMRNGKVQKLYDYLEWQIKEFGYATREDMVDGSLHTNTANNFSRALVHPMFDTVLQKAFTMDRATEQNTPFKHLLKNMKWDKFNTSENLATDVSHKLFEEILTTQNINKHNFVSDVYDILTLKKPKQNLMFIEGVPNSGKSFIARSISALFKYSATIQGTSSFPFMELANASIGLIEEPVFNIDALQTLKKGGHANRCGRKKQKS